MSGNGATDEPIARVDPQMREPLRRFIDFAGAGGFHCIADLQMRRVRYAEAMEIASRRGPGVSEVPRRDIAISRSNGGDLSVRIYVPSAVPEPLPCVLYFHGGGLIMGSIATEDGFAAALARDVQCAVFSVEYGLAPEHKRASAVEDCYDALYWVHANAVDLGIDARRIGLVGNSAGGGLAAGLSLLARRRGGPAIVHQMLIYPMLDDRNTTASMLSAPALGVWDRAASVEAWSLVLGEHPGVAETPEHVAPARTSECSGLPPTYIEVGDLDIFHDESRIFADRLKQAGVPVEFHCYPGAYHAFDQLAPKADTTARALSNRSAALKRVFG